MTGTFDIISTTEGRKPWPFLDLFVYRDEEFVVHVTLTDPAVYRVSHRASGYGVPNSSGNTVEQAKARGELIVKSNWDALKKAVAKVTG